MKAPLTQITPLSVNSSSNATLAFFLADPAQAAEVRHAIKLVLHLAKLHCNMTSL